MADDEYTFSGEQEGDVRVLPDAIPHGEEIVFHKRDGYDQTLPQKC